MWHSVRELRPREWETPQEKQWLSYNSLKGAPMGQMRSADDPNNCVLRALNSVRGHWISALLPFYKDCHELLPPLSRRESQDFDGPSKQLGLPI